MRWLFVFSSLLYWHHRECKNKLACLCTNRIAIGRTNECFWICSCWYELMWSSVSGAAPGLADKVSTPGNKKAAFQSVAHYPGEYLALHLRQISRPSLSLRPTKRFCKASVPPPASTHIWPMCTETLIREVPPLSVNFFCKK